MRDTFRILFYIKRNSPLRDGSVPVMGRITINGARSQFSTHLSVPPESWDVRQGRMSGRSRTAAHVNARLESIRFTVERCYYDARCYERGEVTPEMVKERFMGNISSRETLLGFFRRHNEEFERMVGVSRSRATYNKYRCVYLHLERYLHERLQWTDLEFSELTHEFLVGFHAYIACECGHRKNTVWVYLTALKHIVGLARSRGYLDRDPFADYRFKGESVPRSILSMEEIRRVAVLDPGSAMLRFIRDVFLFSCFTGLSYADIGRLTMRNFESSDGQLWLNTSRCKTGTSVSVRLFAVPRTILRIYAPESNDVPIFRLPSNGWCNHCLERIMTLAGIHKRVTFHSARHTFATTVTLAQGVAIETIGKLLGHKNIRTTQIYASVTHSHLRCELDRLEERLESVSELDFIQKVLF